MGQGKQQTHLVIQQITCPGASGWTLVSVKTEIHSTTDNAIIGMTFYLNKIYLK